MKTIRIVLITATLAAGLLVLAGCATTGAMAATSQDDFTAMVKTAFAQYSGSLVAGDANRWMSLWDVNGVQLPPDSPMVMSTEDLRAGMTATLEAAHFKAMDIKLTKAWVDHELGFATGNYTYTLVTSDGTTVNYDGKYQTIFRRQPDGSWKIFRDCFNSNLAP
jgi:ketosteroid isomerase-like protein